MSRMTMATRTSFAILERFSDSRSFSSSVSRYSSSVAHTSGARVSSPSVEIERLTFFQRWSFPLVVEVDSESLSDHGTSCLLTKAETN